MTSADAGQIAMGRSGPLGQQVTAGFAWMASQAVLAKALALAGQMVLAYILGPRSSDWWDWPTPSRASQASCSKGG